MNQVQVAHDACVDSNSKGFLTIDVPYYKASVFDLAWCHKRHYICCCCGCDDGLTRV